jgi:hypothetical protein
MPESLKVSQCPVFPILYAVVFVLRERDLPIPSIIRAPVPGLVERNIRSFSTRGSIFNPGLIFWRVRTEGGPQVRSSLIA